MSIHLCFYPQLIHLRLPNQIWSVLLEDSIIYDSKIENFDKLNNSNNLRMRPYAVIVQNLKKSQTLGALQWFLSKIR